MSHINFFALFELFMAIIKDCFRFFRINPKDNMPKACFSQNFLLLQTKCFLFFIRRFINKKHAAFGIRITLGNKFLIHI